MSGTRTEPPSPERAGTPPAPAGPARRPARPRRARPLARVATDARLAWSVALVLALVLAVVAMLTTPVVLEARDRAQVRDVAALAATRLATYDAADLDRWAEGLQAISTDAYAEEFAGLLDEPVRDDLAEAGVVSRGEVTDVFVQRVESSQAQAFAVVRQVTVSAARAEPAAATVRMTLRLRRVGGDWRVDGIDVLAGGAPVPFDVPADRP